MKETEVIIEVFKTFCDVNRLKILEILRSNEKCACVLLEDLKIGQSTLSHHMNIQCDSGIVDSRKSGTRTYYTISRAGCEKAMELIAHLAEPVQEKGNTFCCKA